MNLAIFQVKSVTFHRDNCTNEITEDANNTFISTIKNVHVFFKKSDNSRAKSVS